MTGTQTREACRHSYGTLTPEEKINCHADAIIERMDSVAIRSSKEGDWKFAPLNDKIAVRMNIAAIKQIMTETPPKPTVGKRIRDMERHHERVLRGF